MKCEIHKVDYTGTCDWCDIERTNEEARAYRGAFQVTDSLIKFKQRSTGEVAAPKFKDCRCGSRNGSKCFCVPCENCGVIWGHTVECLATGKAKATPDHMLEATLATSVERAATVKAIDEMLNARDIAYCNPMVALRELRGRITSGPTFGPETEKRLAEYQQTLKASLVLMETAGKTAERDATLKLIDAAVEAHAGSSAHLEGARTALRELRRVIEQGRHVS